MPKVTQLPSAEPGLVPRVWVPTSALCCSCCPLPASHQPFFMPNLLRTTSQEAKSLALPPKTRRRGKMERYRKGTKGRPVSGRGQWRRTVVKAFPGGSYDNPLLPSALSKSDSDFRGRDEGLFWTLGLGLPGTTCPFTQKPEQDQVTSFFQFS